jgi:putative tryptophan/tyrosine transport system substrate-binding protein
MRTIHPTSSPPESRPGDRVRFSCVSRRTLLLGSFAAISLDGRGSAAQGRRRIGWLVFGGPKLGPVDGMLFDALASVDATVAIEYRYANSVQELKPLAIELAALRPDILVGFGGDVVAALRSASETIPIVGATSDDPVRAGHALSFARPGKNFTGVTFITDEMSGKRLEVLKEAAPRIQQIGVLWNPQHLDDEMTHLRQAAAQMGLGLSSHELHAAEGLGRVLEEAVSAAADALFIIPSRLTGALRERIATFARERKWPTVASWREFTQSGCLLSYGPDRRQQGRRLAYYIQRVLAGAKPGDLPIERPATFELVINRKTAAAIGIEVPLALLARADEVIE